MKPDQRLANERCSAQNIRAEMRKKKKNQNEATPGDQVGAGCRQKSNNLLGIAKGIRSRWCGDQPSVRPPETIPWLGVRGGAGRIVDEL